MLAHQQAVQRNQSAQEKERERKRDVKKLMRGMSDLDVYRVIRLQALVRGWLERRRFKDF